MTFSDDGAVQDDDEDGPLLDFVFDGTVRSGPRLQEGREQVLALRREVENVLAGSGNLAGLKQALTSLLVKIDTAVRRFQESARKFPQRADYDMRSVEAYQRASEAVAYMMGYLEDPLQRDVLVHGMSYLESAVADVD